MNRLIAAQQARIEELEAEITRLRAALETARRDALEEAWKVADVAADTALKQSGQGHAHGWCAYRMAQAQEIASAIRALTQPNTSDAD